MTVTFEDNDDLDDDTELAERFGPRATYYLDRRDPASRAAGWLVAILAGLILWLLIGLALVLTLG